METDRGDDYDPFVPISKRAMKAVRKAEDVLNSADASDELKRRAISSAASVVRKDLARLSDSSTIALVSTAISIGIISDTVAAKYRTPANEHLHRKR